MAEDEQNVPKVRQAVDDIEKLGPRQKILHYILTTINYDPFEEKLRQCALLRHLSVCHWCHWTG